MAAPGVVLSEAQPAAVRGATSQNEMGVPGVSITQVAFHPQNQVALAPQPEPSDPNLDCQPALRLSIETVPLPGERQASLKARVWKRASGAKARLKQRDKNMSLVVKLKVPKGHLTSTPALKSQGQREH